MKAFFSKLEPKIVRSRKYIFFNNIFRDTFLEVLSQVRISNNVGFL